MVRDVNFRITLGEFSKIGGRMDLCAGFLWAVEGQEDLHEDFDEAVEEYLDMCDLDKTTEIDVVEYQQQEKEIGFYSPLALLLEHLDEEYAAGDYTTEATKDMEDAEQEFIAKVLKDYYVYRHDPTGVVVTVDVAEWVKKNKPSWVKDLPKEENR